MKGIFTERRIIILLFIVTIIVFSFASNDARNLQLNSVPGPDSHASAVTDQQAAASGTAARD